MELSYATYNYPSGLALPPIPGLFMGDMSDTATDILHEYGFVDDHPEDDIEENIWEENYVPLVGVAAHTIGHREITIIDNSTTGDDNNDISGTNLNSVNVSNANLSTVGGNNANTISNNSESDFVRQLVVVSVRGSVSLGDWVVDLANQVNSPDINFETGFQEVVDSLYGVEHCEEHSSKNLNCEKCIGYLASKGITNPIILITGHSLGAAVANLVADELNKTEGQADI